MDSLTEKCEQILDVLKDLREDRKTFNEDQKKYNKDQKNYNEDQKNYNENNLKEFTEISKTLKEVQEAFVVL